MSDTQFVLIGENTLEVAFVMEVSREMNDHEKLYGRYKPNQHDIGSISGLTEALAGIDTKEGNLEDLTTDNKENLVGAINEVDLHADNNATNLSNHIADKSNPHEVTKAQVGLGNCDNTSDLNKPISTATQSALTNITNGTTSIAYDNTTSGLSATTLQGAIDEIDSDLDNVEDLIPSAASTSNQLADKSYVDTADNDLQSQIDAIAASSDVTDIVGTYSELQAYDTSTLTNDDIIKVLQDESQGGATTYYRWVVSGSSGSFVLIGSEGPYYTKAEADDLLAEKQDKITATNKLDSDMVDDTGQTNKFVTASEKSQISTNTSDITALQSGKADKSTTYTKTEVDTIASGKANVGLDNLNTDGQMIIDSQNGTISNCILEIPHNIKVELVDNILTLKAESTLVKTGDTYATVTTGKDLTYDYSNKPNGIYVQTCTNSGGSLGFQKLIGKLGSGDTLPTDNTNYEWFYLSGDRKIYVYTNGAWSDRNVTYPFCLVNVENGVASFAKDSDGNDMIFNGACFVGHHAAVYPNIKELISDGFNKDGSLKSTLGISNSLSIIELSGTAPDGYDRNIYTTNGRSWGQFTANEVNDVSELSSNSVLYSYVKNKNKFYHISSNAPTAAARFCLVKFIVSGSTVTDFTIRQPVRLATTEMLNKVQDQVATRQIDVTTLTGYDSTKTQTLKNVNGILTWVDD